MQVFVCVAILVSVVDVLGMDGMAGAVAVKAEMICWQLLRTRRILLAMWAGECGKINGVMSVKNDSDASATG